MEAVGVSFAALGLLVNQLPSIIKGFELAASNTLRFQAFNSRVAMIERIIEEQALAQDSIAHHMSRGEKATLEELRRSCAKIISVFRSSYQNPQPESRRAQVKFFLRQGALETFGEELLTGADLMGTYLTQLKDR